jgi:hypothetical protein
LLTATTSSFFPSGRRRFGLSRRFLTSVETEMLGAAISRKGQEPVDEHEPTCQNVYRTCDGHIASPISPHQCWAWQIISPRVRMPKSPLSSGSAVR